MSLIIYKIKRTFKPRSTDSGPDQAGIGLVEIIISLGVAMVIVTSMVSLAIFTLRTSNESENLMKGSRMVNQHMERIRAFRDEYSTWSDFYNLLTGVSCSENCTGTSCFVDDSIIFDRSSSPPGFDGITTCFYVEEVEDSPGVIDRTKLDVIVVATWMSGDERKFTHSYSRLSNWQR